MTTEKKNLRTCINGHRFYKSSDCPVCPVCAAAEKPEDGILSAIGAPARRALERAGITTAEELSKWSTKEILKLHGMGPSSIPKLEKALMEYGLKFRGSS